MIKRHISFPLFICMTLMLGMFISCSEDRQAESQQSLVLDDSNLVEAKLSFQVASMNSSSTATRATDLEGTDEERKIDNIWVFQFDATTNTLLTTPHYYEGINASPTASEGKEVDVLLKPNVASIIYVVANIGSSTWVSNVDDFATLDAVKAKTLPEPYFKAFGMGETVTDLSLPMEGGTTGSVTPSDGSTITIPLTRMYAKMEIMVEDIPESIILTAVNVQQIPFYCRVGTLATEDNPSACYPTDNTYWTSHAFSPGEKDTDGKYTGKMVLYLPENLQGTTTSTEADAAYKSENVPTSYALEVDFVANYVDIFTGDEKETGRQYIIYPGANNYNDYNIKRNNIYQVTLNIYSDEYDQDTPSSNCFVVKPGQTLSFLPYYRTETGGGYDFTDYLNAYGEDSKQINHSETMTENIEIIWQTKDCIGDNSNGDLVWIDDLADVANEYHREIHVKTNAKGNALIAAYNSNGDIIWSWHIWVTDHEPDNVSNAVVYSTYAWNESGIVTSVRVPGYAVMSCNLGAMEDTQTGTRNNINLTYPTYTQTQAFGLLYQWGRKDPFPPLRYTGSAHMNYDDTHTDTHYGNDGTTVVHKTSTTTTDYLFHSVIGSDLKGAVNYSIAHPTVFICGTNLAYQNENYVEAINGATLTNYFNGGDWCPVGESDNKLWGGLEPGTDGMKSLTVYTRTNGDIHLYDNYGDAKSIFDPCPSGWRVPPGELWLGFTSTGKNPSSMSQINYWKNDGYGMYMYMQAWRSGDTSYFPVQGTRVGDGAGIRVSSCGNYHNATTDLNNRVNILHVHNAASLFHIFEYSFPMYYVKSTAGPIRCVRDHK